MIMISKNKNRVNNLWIICRQKITAQLIIDAGGGRVDQE